jgi:hypothetical protein
MEPNELNEEPQSLSENLDMATYIMLHRIYDALVIIGNKIVGSEDMDKMVKYHDQGLLLGPVPSYTPQDIDEK